jgi:MATE family multidrug resistance protein
VALNYALIFGHFSFPRLGLNGAACATAISRLFMFLAMFAFVRYSHDYKMYRHLKQHEHDSKYLKEIFRVGLPSGLQYFFEVGAFAFAAIMIGWISEYAQAAHQIAINIASVTYMIATGIAAGGSIAVGNAYGRRHRADIILSGKATIWIGGFFMGICALLFVLFDQFIISLYIDDVEVARMAKYLLWIAALFQLSDGIQAVGLGILRGISDTKIPTAITIVAYWVIGIPVGYYMGFKMTWSLYGVWVALLLGLTFSALALTIRFIRLSKRVDLDYHSKLPHVVNPH